MRRSIPSTLVTTLALSASFFVAPAWADFCVSAEYPRPTQTNVIGVDPGLLSSEELQAAFDEWEACNGYGLGFPSFQQDAGNSSYATSVDIFFNDSVNPEGNCGLWQQTNAEGPHHQIEIWTSITAVEPSSVANRFQ